MEVLNSIAKDLNNVYRVGIAVLIFVLWPLAISYFYLVDPALFKSVDTLKLTLLGAAFTMPLVLINSIALYFVLMPLNDDLRLSRPVLEPTASAFLFSSILTTFLVLIGDIVACFQHNQIPIWTIIFLEVLVALICGVTIYKESD